MSRIKDYIVSSVEKQVDKIINQYIMNIVNIKTATDQICGVDNIEMVVDKENVEEMLIMEKEDYWKKANKQGRSKTHHVRECEDRLPLASTVGGLAVEQIEQSDIYAHVQYFLLLILPLRLLLRPHVLLPLP